MTMIAEGVESLEHLDTLNQFGCDEIQGYWLAKPMPAAECLAFIIEHEKLSRRDGMLDCDANAI
jgi:EAL domain-containing protein (putative c-di-GMP-specific phosphodiesterase class I)